MIEFRTIWLPVEEPPTGWRFLHNDIDSDGYWSLWTAAPHGYPVPMDGVHAYKWIESLPHKERREVTEWCRA